MNLRLLIVAILFAITGLTGCGGGDPHKDHDHSKDAHKDHDHSKEGHKDHDHAKDDKDHKHGENEGTPRALGKADIAGYSAAVTLFGEVKAGGEVALDVVLTGGTGEPAAVRAWVGIETADGSIKAKLAKEKTAWHNHLEVPAKLPEGAAIWVEIEDGKGEKKSAKFAW